MTRILLLILLLSGCLPQPLLAQPPEKVGIRLRNNGLRPREFKFVTRCPDEKYPDVFTTFLLPGAVYKGDFKIGTSIAQVTQAEIYQTMKGRFVPGKPLLVVKADDKGKTFNLARK